MLEAYKIGVNLNMTNGLTGPLTQIVKQLQLAHKETTALQSVLSSLGKMDGGGMGAGIATLNKELQAAAANVAKLKAEMVAVSRVPAPGGPLNGMYPPASRYSGYGFGGGPLTAAAAGGGGNFNYGTGARTNPMDAYGNGGGVRSVYPNGTGAVSGGNSNPYTSMFAGGMIAGAGKAIFGGLISGATEYAHQLNIINMAGWTQKEQAEAVGDAWKNTHTVITTTATENLKTFLDLKNILGDFGDARAALPVVSRIQSVLASSSENKISGNAKEYSYSMAKALDMIGAAQNTKKFEHEAELMSNVIIETQGRVTPEAYKSVFQYARQAKYGLSDEFKYEILPSLMQENAGAGGGGGGSRGVGPMIAALYRATNQGYINKKSLPLLQELGLVSGSTALKTTTSGTTVGAWKNSELAASNPFEYGQQVILPAIKHRYGENVTKEIILKTVNEMFRGNQLAAAVMGEYLVKPVNFYRDQQNIRKTMGTKEAYSSAISYDPNTAFKALDAQWENFKVSFTMGVVPVLIPALIKLAGVFDHLGAWARENPTAAKVMALGVASLAGLGVVAGGVLLIGGAFIMLAGAAAPIVGLLGSVATAVGVVAGGLGALSLAKKAGSAISDWWDGSAGGHGMRPPGFNPVAPQNKTTVVHTTVNMDGKPILKLVDTHMNKQAKKPMSGTSRHDGNMSLQPVGASGSW